MLYLNGWRKDIYITVGLLYSGAHFTLSTQTRPRWPAHQLHYKEPQTVYGPSKHPRVVKAI